MSIQAVVAVWLADKAVHKYAVMDIETVLDEPFSFAFDGLDTELIALFDRKLRVSFPMCAFMCVVWARVLIICGCANTMMGNGIFGRTF